MQGVDVNPHRSVREKFGAPRRRQHARPLRPLLGSSVFGVGGGREYVVVLNAILKDQ
jgi:hypothetical protein